MRRRDYRYRILEMCLRDQQLKTIWYIHRLLYQNLMGATNQKSIADRNSKEKAIQTHY